MSQKTKDTNGLYDKRKKTQMVQKTNDKRHKWFICIINFWSFLEDNLDDSDSGGPRHKEEMIAVNEKVFRRQLLILVSLLWITSTTSARNTERR